MKNNFKQQANNVNSSGYLLSDVDAFGLFNVYKYFRANPNSTLLPLIQNQRVLTVDYLFEYYYNPAFIVGDTTNYPIQSNYKLRWLNFCRGFDTNRNVVETPNPTGDELVYQGFISKNNTTHKYEWVANLNPTGTEHQSVAKLRKRAEAFAHFWYQFQYSKAAIGGVLWGGEYDGVLGRISLQRNKQSENKIIRFERENKLSLTPQKLSNYIAGKDVHPNQLDNATDSTELEYVLSEFLNYIKTNFEAEKEVYKY